MRSIGVVYPVLFVLFFAATAKSYFLAPIYSILCAAGAVVAEPVLSRSRWRFPAASLPVDERERAVTFETNYGDAGAIEVSGVGRGLPPVVCGHNSY